MPPTSIIEVEKTETKKVRGFSGGKDFFRFEESGEINAQMILDVLQGKIAGVIFRNILDKDDCQRLVDGFWNSDKLQRRGFEAPGYYLGAYHYLKDPDQFFDECEEAAAAVEAFEQIKGSPSTLFFDALSALVAPQGVTIRAVEHQGRKACGSLIRSWTNDGSHSLAPHDDEAQVLWPGQSELELQKVARNQVCAFNACIQNDGGGELVYWNVIPSGECRRELGVEFTGSPYDVEMLSDFDSLTIPIRSGDVYIFNGAYVHAVASLTGQGAGRRTTMSCLCGFSDDKTILRWS